MTTPNVRDLMVVPGRLSYGPSSLTSDYPHGGTALGLVAGVAVTFPQVSAEEGDVIDEAKGGEITESVQQKQSIRLAAFLHSWDNDALSVLFPNTSIPTGAGKTGRRIINEPGSTAAGSRMSSRGVVLVFTPDDADNAPMLVIRNAIPSVLEAEDMAFTLGDRTRFAVIFRGIRDSGGDLYDCGYRKDLTL